MKREFKRFKDDLHHIEVLSSSKTMAWAMIRNRCHIAKKKVPLLSQIKEI